jgi:hypothetical protein
LHDLPVTDLEKERETHWLTLGAAVLIGPNDKRVLHSRMGEFCIKYREIRQSHLLSLATPSHRLARASL